MIQPSRRPVPTGLVLAVVAILLLAANLRTAVGGLSPLAPVIGDELALSAGALGLLGVAAPLGFALAGLVTPGIAHRLGLERTIVAALAVMVLGHLLRAVAPNVGTLLAGSLVVLLAAGVGNILLPAATKRYAPNRIALVTTLYGTVMSVGASLPPLIAVPIAAGLDWRVSLGVWSIVAAAAVIPWVLLVRRAPRMDDASVVASAPDARGAFALARSRTVGGITIAFGLSSVSAYALFAVLPEVLREEAGVGPAAGGALVALFGILGLPLALVVPAITQRRRTPTPLLVTATALFAVGWGGLWLAPDVAPVLWVVAVGLGQISFPMGLTLIGLRTADDRTAAAVSGFVQTVGYLVAAVVPPVLGALREVTGSWQPAMGVMAVMTVLTITAVPLLRGGRTVEQELGRV